MDIIHSPDSTSSTASVAPIEKCRLLAEKLEKLEQLGNVYSLMKKREVRSGKRKLSLLPSDSNEDQDEGEDLEDCSDDSEYNVDDDKNENSEDLENSEDIENSEEDDEEGEGDESDEGDDEEEEEEDEEDDDEDSDERKKRQLKALNTTPFLSAATKKLIKKGILERERKREGKAEVKSTTGDGSVGSSVGSVGSSVDGGAAPEVKKAKKIPKGEWSQCLEGIWSLEKRRYKPIESKETMDKLTSSVLDHSLELEKKTPSLRKIIESELDEKTKQELISMQILHENADFGSEKLAFREKITEKLNAKKLSPETLALKNRLYKASEANDTLEDRIFELELPEEQIKIIHQTYLRYVSMSGDDGNSKAKTKEWIDYAMRLPTKIKPLMGGAMQGTCGSLTPGAMLAPYPPASSSGAMLAPYPPASSSGAMLAPYPPASSSSSSSSSAVAGGYGAGTAPAGGYGAGTAPTGGGLIRGADIAPPIAECLVKIKKTLDASLYGMKKEKEELLLVINTLLSNPKCSNMNLGFVGEAGMGKTELVRSLAKALDIPFTHISMGGCHDASFLTGHNIVYEGAQPGAIVKALCRTGYKNGIIYFDEIDKMEETTRGKGVMNTLLHVLDPAQSKIFQDNFLDELPIDISQIWMMYSLNDKKKLEKPLLDRMHIIFVANYDKHTKVQIIKLFSIPKIMENIGLTYGVDVVFPDESIKHLVNLHTDDFKDDFGIRGLNQAVLKILSRVSILKNIYCASVTDKSTSSAALTTIEEIKKTSTAMLDLSFKVPGIKFPLVITPELVDRFLADRKDKDNFSAFHSMIM